MARIVLVDDGTEVLTVTELVDKMNAEGWTQADAALHCGVSASYISAKLQSHGYKQRQTWVMDTEPPTAPSDAEKAAQAAKIVDA